VSTRRTKTYQGSKDDLDTHDISSPSYSLRQTTQRHPVETPPHPAAVSVVEEGAVPVMEEAVPGLEAEAVVEVVVVVGGAGVVAAVEEGSRFIFTFFGESKPLTTQKTPPTRISCSRSSRNAATVRIDFATATANSRRPPHCRHHDHKYDHYHL